jgi:hypothetical protein
MSHFTRVKTRMVEKVYLQRALEDLGYRCVEGGVKVQGFAGRRARADLKVVRQDSGGEIGFRRTEDGYELVADWWSVRGVKQEQFLGQVMQRYAYQAARAKLEEQGFTLVTEENQKDGQIHLVLRRTT